MKVRFAQNWFGPDHHLYSRTDPGVFQDVREDFRDQIPPGSTVLDDGEDAPEVVKPVVTHSTLRDLDDQRAVADAEAAVMAKAEANRLALKRK